MLRRRSWFRFVQSMNCIREGSSNKLFQYAWITGAFAILFTGFNLLQWYCMQWRMEEEFTKKQSWFLSQHILAVRSEGIGSLVRRSSSLASRCYWLLHHTNRFRVMSHNPLRLSFIRLTLHLQRMYYVRIGWHRLTCFSCRRFWLAHWISPFDLIETTNLWLIIWNPFKPWQKYTMNKVICLAFLIVSSVSAFVSKTPFVASSRSGHSLSMAMERTYIMVCDVVGRASLFCNKQSHHVLLFFESRLNLMEFREALLETSLADSKPRDTSWSPWKHAWQPRNFWRNTMPIWRQSRSSRSSETTCFRVLYVKMTLLQSSYFAKRLTIIPISSGCQHGVGREGSCFHGPQDARSYQSSRICSGNHSRWFLHRSGS